jgi:8-oxo-dGTP pyrophosphatase MutT (NUDIX family)
MPNTSGRSDVCVNLLSRLREQGMHPKENNHPEHSSLPRASVLVPIFVRRRAGNDDGPSRDDPGGACLFVLLTQRPTSLRTHAGEVCFPGGKQDLGDQQDDVVTALREANEEIGLDPDHVVPLCRLGTLESYTGLCVTPIVGLIQPSDSAEPSQLNNVSKDEVDAVFAVPLTYFANDANLTSKQNIEWRGGEFEMRTYHYNAECGRTFKIWGLTAYIAHQVAKITFAPLNEASAAYRITENPTTCNNTPPSLPSMSGYLLRQRDKCGRDPY